jgi:hypothetical protein
MNVANWIRGVIGKLTWPIRVIFSSPLSLLSSPERMLGMSLPVRVAVFVFLILLVSTVAIFYFTMTVPNAADWRNWFDDWWDPIVVGILLLVIPFISYRLVVLWLEQDGARFPEIDRAWADGISALRSHNCDLTGLPLFLVTGPRNEVQARALMSSSGMQFFVDGAPHGPSDLHWFASEEGIFLVCTRTCRTGVLSAEAMQGGVSTSRGAKNIFAATMDSTDFSASQTGFGTMSGLDDSIDDNGGSQAAPSYFGTMDAAAGFDGGSSGSSGRASGQAQTVRLTSQKETEATEKLEYVCHLLRRHRQPYCPINGVLSFVPFDLLCHSEDQTTELQKTLRSDNSTISSHLQLRCPVICLIGGMEIYSGFRELVRRVGKERALENRFGRGFDVWNPPIPEQLEALARHACGQFEAWVYRLFREDRELQHHGNPKLYSLLCLIRGYVVDRLVRVVDAGYAKEGDDCQRSLLFAGCYFAATGDKADQQVFVRSVFSKLVDQFDELDWHDDVRVADARCRTLRDLLLFGNVVLLVLIGAILWLRFS